MLHFHAFVDECLSSNELLCDCVGSYLSKATRRFAHVTLRRSWNTVAGLTIHREFFLMALWSLLSSPTAFMFFDFPQKMTQRELLKNLRPDDALREMNVNDLALSKQTREAIHMAPSSIQERDNWA